GRGMASFFSWFTGRPSRDVALGKAVTEARERASRGRRREVTDLDLLLAILPDDDVMEALRGCGVDLLTLGEAVQRFVQETARVQKEGTVNPRPTVYHETVLRYAEVEAGHPGVTVTPLHLLRGMLMFSFCPSFSFLSEHGVTRARLLCALAHGSPSPESKPTAVQGELAQVVIHNDNFTNMDFVVDVLERVGGLEQPKATELMLQVHREGKSTLGAMFREDALKRAALINAYARRHGAPLLATVEEPD
ncbi:MAG: ATP-dependent Clp protease adaptor ClpS, partial [Myxococcota bacterium]